MTKAELRSMISEVLKEELKLHESSKFAAKTTDKLCSVVFDGKTQIFTGTHKECEDWLNTKGVMHRDRLTIKDSANIAIKEAVGTTTVDIIRRYDNNVSNHISELEHEEAWADAEWFESDWYVLKDVKVTPDYYTLVMDRPVESIQDAELIINYAFDNMIVGFEEAMSDGGIVQDPNSNEIYLERWVID